ncbi:hypothetical protein [Martelella mediterranea]|nr:hypothetical protein [Martelella mediterranea]
MVDRFRDIFIEEKENRDEFAKYASRLFGIFSEKIISIWAEDPRSTYIDLGRPTLREHPGDRGYTLDFTLQNKLSKKIYVAEMKCEIEYQNFRYFVLKESSQIDHHKKPAFDIFLKSAKKPEDIHVSLKRKPIEAHGAILVWGAVDRSATSAIAEEKGFHEILSVEEICDNLSEWENEAYIELIKTRQTWSNALFDGLLSL